MCLFQICDHPLRMYSTVRPKAAEITNKPMVCLYSMADKSAQNKSKQRVGNTFPYFLRQVRLF